MRDRARTALLLLSIATLMMGTAPSSTATDGEESAHKNLQVLPKDISRDELGDTMLDILRGLGLPRRAGEGCLFCHAGSLDVPRGDWDYASDEKPMKQKARVMLQMVRTINDGHLAKLAERASPTVDVSCATCHAGRTNPTPLPQLLLARYGEGGVDALTETYREARDRYFAADAYDFRVSTLIGVANGLAAEEAYDDAARVHELNIEFHDDAHARGGLIRVRMLQALEEKGVDAMVERYQALKAEHPAEAFGPGLLGPLAWALFRGGQQDEGFRLFELGYAEHPDSYPAVENLAWGCEATGDHTRAIALAEGWLKAHPDHELGQRLLFELRQSENR